MSVKENPGCMALKYQFNALLDIQLEIHKGGKLLGVKTSYRSESCPP